MENDILMLCSEFLEIKKSELNDREFEEKIFLLSKKYKEIIEKQYIFNNLPKRHIFSLLQLLHDFNRGIYDEPHPMSQMRHNALSGAKRLFG
jgi:hypothetical protein